MAYKIIIESTAGQPEGPPGCVPIKIFEQTVESLNLKAVINTINAAPRKPRAPKAK